MTRFAVVFPAAARPYPGEVAPDWGNVGITPGAPMDAHSGVVVGMPLATGAHGCTGTRGDGKPCNGNAGTDGRCARHKE